MIHLEVIGFPVAHSKSPAMMAAAFRATGIAGEMIAHAIAPEDLATEIAVLRTRLAGASVTIPHKLAVVALCDHVTDDARAIGAVNCLQFTSGKIVGHNTDSGGFVDGLRRAGFDPAGKRTVILGAGGAARAIAHGIPGAIVVTRARWGELATLFADADLVVDATPVGLDDREPHGLPLDALPHTAVVASLIYHRRPAILRDAEARGLATHDGAAMLVHQGARAFTIWTGRPAPVDAMEQALHAAIAS